MKSKRNNFVRKTLSVIVVFSLVFCSLCYTVGAAEKPNDRLLDVFLNEVKIIEEKTNFLMAEDGYKPISLTIDNIKAIKDFANNNYTLIECSPTGYLIYHNESGNFVESSAVAISPYSKCNSSMIYGGPNEYYSENNSIYTNLISDEEINSQEISKHVSLSQIINKTLNENENLEIKDYISGKNIIIPKFATQYSNSNPAKTSTYNGMTVVNNYKFFTKLSDCGYCTINNQGICGYIAAGILLTYEQVTNGGNFVSSTYYSGNSSSGYSIKKSFPKAL